MSEWNSENKKNTYPDTSKTLLNKRIALKDYILVLKNEGNTAEEILSILSGEQKEEIRIPVSVFSARTISALEVIVRYLADERRLRYSEIAKLLLRDQRTISATYHNSVKKQKDRLLFSESVIKIPVLIFANRNLSVLEALVSYLSEFGLTTHQIALTLKRRDSTIATVASRYKKKHESK